MTSEKEKAAPLASGQGNGTGKAYNSTDCPFCGFPIPAYHVYDLSVFCPSCGRFRTLPDPEPLPPLTERVWRVWQGVAP